MRCVIAQQIAEHLNEDSCVCPECGMESLSVVNYNDKHVKCDNCDYERDMRGEFER